MAADISFQVFFFAFCTCFSLLLVATPSHGHQALDKHVPLFFFGDSYFDPGNNNHINTTFRANYWPYGQTFFKHPTGRFSNGRLISDFIAEYAELPLIPPYLQPAGDGQFKYGANFASAGAGALVETGQGLVIDLQTQLSYFKSVSKSLKKKLGDEEAKNLLSRALYLFSVGGNDYVFPFETNSSVLRSYTHHEFVGLVLGNITAVIKEIYREGGRSFGFLSLDPLGCLPYARAIVKGEKGGCFEGLNPYVKLHNEAFSKLLQTLETELKGFRYSLSGFYEFLKERISHPSKYGFEEGKAACCGSGPYGGIYSCGGKRGVKEYELCDNVSEYVFFDSGHPTERVFEQFAKQFWSGTTNSTAPYNLKALFQNN